jgi:hypothetical protein
MDNPEWDEGLFGDDSAEWQNYPADGKHTVVGTIKVSRPLNGAAEGVRRRLLVYLPPSYARTEKGYPVLYMHDGQNLFDEAVSFSGEWQVDETMEALSKEGIEAIVVGSPTRAAGVRWITRRMCTVRMVGAGPTLTSISLCGRSSPK